jgi:hypothetical protein
MIQRKRDIGKETEVRESIKIEGERQRKYRG